MVKRLITMTSSCSKARRLKRPRRHPRHHNSLMTGLLRRKTSCSARCVRQLPSCRLHTVRITTHLTRRSRERYSAY